MMLIDEAKLLDLLDFYAPESALFIAVAAVDTIISTIFQEHFGTDFDLLTDERSFPFVLQKHISIIPFSILVAADKTYLFASTNYFTISVVVMIITFVLALLIYAHMQRKHFFAPMFSVINSMESLNEYNIHKLLPQTKSIEFDHLINKINEMLIRLEHNNELIQKSQLLAKNAEIERQKALIFSLKKQINAHFTINTLSTVKILVEQREIELASDVIDNLSSMIQYAFDKDEFINVWNEFDILKKYISIMNTRYCGMLEFNLDVDDRLMG